jgi:MscS family membrane protein
MFLIDLIKSIFDFFHFEKIGIDLEYLEVALSILLIIFAAILASYLFSKLTNKLNKIFSHKNKNVLQIVVSAVDDPIHFLIWIYAIYNAISEFPFAFSKSIVTQLGSNHTLLIECFIGWSSFRIIDGLHDYVKEHELTKSKKIDKTLIGTVSKVLKLIVFISISIMVLDSLGVRVTGLITFAGIGTAAIGFASKDLFANYLGTLVIFFDKPFAIGDEIDLPEKSIEGIVEEINWRITKIRTHEHGIIFVPNSYFYNSHIRNNSKINSSRIFFSVHIDPHSLNKIESLVSEIRDKIFMHPSIDSECEHSAICLDSLSSYGPSLLIDCSARLNDYKGSKLLQQELMLQVLQILSDNKINPIFSKS